MHRKKFCYYPVVLETIGEHEEGYDKGHRYRLIGIDPREDVWTIGEGKRIWDVLFMHHLVVVEEPEMGRIRKSIVIEERWIHDTMAQMQAEQLTQPDLWKPEDSDSDNTEDDCDTV